MVIQVILGSHSSALTWVPDDEEGRSKYSGEGRLKLKSGMLLLKTESHQVFQERKRKVGDIRYEARSRGRSSPDSSAF